MIPVPLWWHASLLEILWLIGGLLATGLTLVNLGDATKDEAIIDDVRDDPSIHEDHYRMLTLAARGRTAEEELGLAISVLIVVTGIVACVIPNPTSKVTLTGFAVTVALDGIAALLAIRSLAVMRRRALLYELAAKRSRVLAAKMRAREEAKHG